MLARRDTEDSTLGHHPRRTSTQNELFGDAVARRLSEAGVNRRPSAAQILTHDTDQFIVGQEVYVDGVKSGRIQFIGETKFGPGDWAGIVLDEPFGRNDGSVGKTRYFQCDPGYGVFSRLFRLTTEPIEGAEGVRDQMRKYGYMIADAPIGRRGSVGSGGGSRRDSVNLDERRSPSPRAVSPEMRRPSLRKSPDRRTSLNVPARRGSQAKSPLASPRIARNLITGGEIRIEKDPDITTLTQEARRLSMGTAANTAANGRRPSGANERVSPRRSSKSYQSNNGSSHSPRRPSEGYKSSHSPRRPSEGYKSSHSPRRPSEANAMVCPSHGLITEVSRHSPRRSIAESNGISSSYRRESLGLPAHRKGSEDTRRGSEAGSRKHSESDNRRLSEAGFSRRTSNTDEILNPDPDSLRIGQVVWVDGNKQGRIAYIGNVQFAKGEVGGVHLVKPYGKNNGTVGGVKYFECEPKHGVFARLHRITAFPLEEEE